MLNRGNEKNLQIAIFYALQEYTQLCRLLALLLYYDSSIVLSATTSRRQAINNEHRATEKVISEPVGYWSDNNKLLGAIANILGDPVWLADVAKTSFAVGWPFRLISINTHIYI